MIFIVLTRKHFPSVLQVNPCTKVCVDFTMLRAERVAGGVESLRDDGQFFDYTIEVEDEKIPLSQHAIRERL